MQMIVEILHIVKCVSHQSLTSGYKSRDEVIVEFIDTFQVHVLRAPDVLIYHVQSCMDNELIQVRVIFALQTVYIRK